MNYLNVVNAVVVSLGVPTIIGFAISLGKKLQVLENLDGTAKNIKHNMKVMSDYLTRHHKKFNPAELQNN
jgi:hypothetical protein